MSGNPFDRRPSDSQRQEVNLRARIYLDEAVQRAYDEGLRRWAVDDDTPFPDRDHIRRRLEAELLTLCRGLGTWAAAEPSTVLGPLPRHRRRHDVDYWE
jgi:hypothetical protein